MEKEYGYQKNPGESREPKEERQETNPAIEAALETFESSISAGNDPETAKSKALIRFNSVGASLTNSAEENQMAFDELQKELESRMIIEKETHVSENRESVPESPLNEIKQEKAAGASPISKETDRADENKESSPEQPKDETKEEKEIKDVFEKSNSPEELEKLPEETKEKIWWGLSKIGYSVKEWKAEQISKVLDKLSEREGFSKRESLARFISALSESYKNDAEDVRKKAETDPQTLLGKRAKDISSVSYIAGLALKPLRLLSDATGYFNPLSPRWLMTTAMVSSRGLGAIKEARFKNEEVIEKTRIQDIEKAKDEAIRIYEKAGGTYDESAGGDGKVSKEKLQKAYQEEIPASVRERLKENPQAGVLSRMTTEIGKSWIDKSMSRLENKFDEIDKNEELSQEKKEIEKQNLLNKQSRRLKDYDRMVDQYGTIDTIAMISKAGEYASNKAVQAMTVETLALAVDKWWDNISGFLVGSAEAEEISPQAEEAIRGWKEETIEPKIGIDSSNGIDQTEAQKIISDIKISSSDEYVRKIRSLYDSESVIGTDKTMGEMIDEALKETSDGSPPDNLPTVDVETESAIADQTDQGSPRERINIPITEPTTAAPIETKPIEPLIDVEPIPSKIEPAKTIENTPVPTETDAEPLSKPEQPKEFVNPILGDRDSIWRSTEDTFRIYRDKLGYNAERDGGDVNKWARKKTAEVMNELAEKIGGSRLPDVVHDNDKIIISIGEDGKPHLRFEESSGLKAGYFEEPKAEKPVEEVVKTREEIEKETETLQGDKFDINIKEPAEIETRPNSPTFDQFKDAYEEIPADGERSGIVKQYILRPEFKNGLIGLGGNREKLDSFVRMFDGNWEKIKDAATLGKSVEEFNSEVTKDTNLLITGKFNEELSDPFAKTNELIDTTFPVESKNGEIFYAHIKGDGSWRVFKADENIGTTRTDKMKMIERDKLFGKDKKFSWQDVRKFLGYETPLGH